MQSDELIIYYGMTVFKKDTNYYLNGAFGRYIDELSQYYKRIKLVLPTLNCDSLKNDYCLSSPNITIIELPFYNGIIDAHRKRKAIISSIRKHAVKWDCPILIRWPTPFFLTVAKIAKDKQLPICYHLVGDPETVVRTGTKYKGVMKIIAVAYAKLMTNTTKNAISDCPTLVNGNGLKRLYSTNRTRLKEIRTSSFYKSEIKKRTREFNPNKIQLLYVGYLRHEKGLGYLLKAVKKLRDKEINVNLTIVGSGDVENELRKIVTELNISQFVIFKGFIPVGEQLFEEYSRADVFVLPSISEGTPRVLLEAMCRGVVVIASNVGGVPFSVKDKFNGLLVPSQNDGKIAEAVELLAKQPELYYTLVKNGYEFANENTIEHHAKEVHDFIEDYCLGRKKYQYIEQHNRWIRFFSQSIPLRLIQLITGILPNSEVSNRIRGILLRPFFKSAGKGLQIASGVIINRIDRISVGKDVYFAHNAWLNGTGEIFLEDGVILGPFSVIASTEHPFFDGKVSNKCTLVAPVRVDSGAWITSHVVITAGICIGEGCLIGANSVITHNTESGFLYGGVPAKKIMKVKEMKIEKTDQDVFVPN